MQLHYPTLLDEWSISARAALREVFGRIKRLRSRNKQCRASHRGIEGHSDGQRRYLPDLLALITPSDETPDPIKNYVACDCRICKRRILLIHNRPRAVERVV